MAADVLLPSGNNAFVPGSYMVCFCQYRVSVVADIPMHGEWDDLGYLFRE